MNTESQEIWGNDRWPLTSNAFNSGFKIKANQPIDSRVVVLSLDDLRTWKPMKQGYPYLGMSVLVLCKAHNDTWATMWQDSNLCMQRYVLVNMKAKKRASEGGNPTGDAVVMSGTNAQHEYGFALSIKGDAGHTNDFNWVPETAMADASSVDVINKAAVVEVNNSSASLLAQVAGKNITCKVTLDVLNLNTDVVVNGGKSTFAKVGGKDVKISVVFNWAEWEVPNSGGGDGGGTDPEPVVLRNLMRWDQVWKEGNVSFNPKLFTIYFLKDGNWIEGSSEEYEISDTSFSFRIKNTNSCDYTLSFMNMNDGEIIDENLYDLAKKPADVYDEYSLNFGTAAQLEGIGDIRVCITATTSNSKHAVNITSKNRNDMQTISPFGEIQTDLTLANNEKEVMYSMKHIQDVVNDKTVWTPDPIIIQITERGAEMSVFAQAVAISVRNRSGVSIFSKDELPLYDVMNGEYAEYFTMTNKSDNYVTLETNQDFYQLIHAKTIADGADLLIDIHSISQ